MVKCVICGESTPHRLETQPQDYEYAVKTSRRFEVWHCKACGSRFIHPRPTVEELISFYPLDYHAYNEDHSALAAILVKIRARARAKSLIKLAQNNPVRLFDVGTGDCRHFNDMSKYGNFEFAGVEIKPEMVEAARVQGYQVEQGTLEELDITPYLGQFDLVTMYQLVEHVLDPACLFKKALALLRPGGYVLGQLPCMDSFERRIFGRYWAGYHYPRHLQMFTRRGLHNLLHQTGFSGVAVKGALHLQATISLQNFLVAKLGYRAKITYGKTPLYPLLMAAVAPYCILEHLFGQGGMMDFKAQKPL